MVVEIEQNLYVAIGRLEASQDSLNDLLAMTELKRKKVELLSADVDRLEMAVNAHLEALEDERRLDTTLSDEQKMVMDRLGCSTGNCDD